MRVRITTLKGKIHVFQIEDHCSNEIADTIYKGSGPNLVIVTNEMCYVYPWTSIAEVEILGHSNPERTMEVQAVAKITSGAFSSDL